MKYRGNSRRAVCAAAGMLLTVNAGVLAESGSPEAPPYSGMLLYGIEHVSGDLVRYHFDIGALVTVGTVTDEDDRIYRGIRGAAYIPGFTNLFAFWRDPDDHVSRLVYVNIDTADAAVVGDNLGPDLVTGAVAVAHEDDYQLYAIAVPQPIAFDMVDGLVVPDETFMCRVDVLDTKITAGGEYDMPVTVRIEAGDETTEPFGPFNNAVEGNVNKGTAAEHIFELPYESGTPLRVTVQSWHRRSGEDGDDADDWTTSMVLDNSTSDMVYVLRNGDDLDDLPHYINRTSIQAIVADHVNHETGVMTMPDDQVIYLMELGATPPHPAADFDDAVVLVRLARRGDELADQYEPPKGRLIRVDHETAESETIMYLQHRYDSLASTDGSVFYGTRDGALYELNPSTYTEMYMAAVSDDRVIGLGQNETALFGFEREGDRVIGMHPETGSGIGLDRFIGADDLGTVMITPEPNYPTESYD